jgi:hypothetical protein
MHRLIYQCAPAIRISSELAQNKLIKLRVAPPWGLHYCFKLVRLMRSEKFDAMPSSSALIHNASTLLAFVNDAHTEEEIVVALLTLFAFDQVQVLNIWSALFASRGIAMSTMQPPYPGTSITTPCRLGEARSNQDALATTQFWHYPSQLPTSIAEVQLSGLRWVGVTICTGRSQAERLFRSMTAEGTMPTTD